MARNISNKPIQHQAEKSKAAQEDALLITRLTIPPVHSPLVDRPQLMARLQAGVGRRLTVVTGPAGSGKTTLLSSWLHKNLQPAAWVSLGDGDNAPARFWAYLIAALQRLYPGVADHVLTMLPALHEQPMEPLLIALINAIATLPQAIVLVLDDYHEIHNQTLHDALAFLLEHMPPQFHLVLASRSEPPLPLARLRAQDNLTEISAADLRFTNEESGTFLQKVLHLPLSMQEVTTLVAYTEGWIVGLSLSALALQGHHDPSAFVATYRGNHRYILDYLSSEVLQRQTQKVQDFLLQTSFLAQLNGALCDAVTGQDASHLLLQQLEQDNVFLIALDDRRHWYRYHHLFAEFLRERLRQSAHAGQLPDLQRRAARWYAEHGMHDDAIRQALTANDMELVVSLIEQAAPTMLMSREVTMLLEWLEAIPDEVVRSHPRLCLFYGWALFHTTRPDSIAPYLQAAERSLQPGMKSEECQALRGEIMALSARVAAYQGDYAHSISLSRQALTYLPEQADTMNPQGMTSGPRSLRGEIELSLGLAAAFNGELGAANQALLEAIASSQAAGNLRTTMMATRYLGGLYADQGRLHQAEEIYRQGLATATKADIHALPPLGYMYVGLGELYYEWNDLMAATRFIQEGIERGRRGGDTKIWLLGMLLLAHTKQTQCDWDGAYALMDEAERLARQTNATRALNWIEIGRIQLELAQGHNVSAARWIQKNGLSLTGQPDTQSEYEYLIFARILISQDQPAMACQILSKLVQLMERTERTGNLISALVIYAIALEADHHSTEAIHILTQALALAEPEDYIRTFVDAGPLLATLLHTIRLMQQERENGRCSIHYLDRLLLACGSASPLTSKSSQHTHASRSKADENGLSLTHQALLEPLSVREQDVLRLIEAGLSNQEIAQALTIGMNTVKSHLKNIYGKLNAHSRTQALRKAKASGLL